MPGGTIANIRSFSSYVTFGKGVSEPEKILLNDAQTSGGLLIFVPAGKKERLISSMQSEGLLAAYIGDVTGELKDDIHVHVEK